MRFRQWIFENDLGITDLDAEVRNHLVQAQAWRDKYNLPPLTDEERQEVIDSVKARHAAWSAETRKANGVLLTVIGMLQQALPDARVWPVGSLAKGQFFTKGRRDYDLDVYVILPDAPPIAGKMVPLPPNVTDAFKKSDAYVRKNLKTVLDIFVKAHGQLWFYKSGKLSQSANAFGKQQFRTSNGLTIRGRRMKWPDFQDSFFQDYPD